MGGEHSFMNLVLMPYGLVIGLWVIWLVVYWRGGWDALHELAQAATRRDQLCLLGLVVMTACIVVHAVLFTIQAAAVHELAWAGALGVLAGAAGTFYCRHWLGKQWTARTTLQRDHQLIDSGPYRIVRHPIYTAAILLYISTGITFPSLWNTVFVLLSVIFYILKTADEDQYLSQHLPGYAGYQRRVPYRLLPRVW